MKMLVLLIKKEKYSHKSKEKVAYILYVSKKINKQTFFPQIISNVVYINLKIWAVVYLVSTPTTVDGNTKSYRACM